MSGGDISKCQWVTEAWAETEEDHWHLARSGWVRFRKKKKKTFARCQLRRCQHDFALCSWPWNCSDHYKPLRGRHNVYRISNKYKKNKKRHRKVNIIISLNQQSCIKKYINTGITTGLTQDNHPVRTYGVCESVHAAILLLEFTFFFFSFFSLVKLSVPLLGSVLR